MLSNLLQESDGVRSLRHRWSRLIEINIAYNTFLHGEVEVGPDKTCINQHVVFQTTHTLLIIYYSYLYSLFDDTKKATHFEKITSKIEHKLPAEVKETRDKILAIWGSIKNQMQRIRHNIGFHGGKNKSSIDDGYHQLHQFSPYKPQLLVRYLHIFFQQLDFVVERSEPMFRQPDKNITEELLVEADQINQLLKSLEEMKPGAEESILTELISKFHMNEDEAKQFLQTNELFEFESE